MFSCMLVLSKQPLLAVPMESCCQLSRVNETNFFTDGFRDPELAIWPYSYCPGRRSSLHGLQVAPPSTMSIGGGVSRGSSIFQGTRNYRFTGLSFFSGRCKLITVLSQPGFRGHPASFVQGWVTQNGHLYTPRLSHTSTSGTFTEEGGDQEHIGSPLVQWTREFLVYLTQRFNLHESP